MNTEKKQAKLYTKELDEFLSYLSLQRNYSDLTVKSYQEDCAFFLGYLKSNGLNFKEVKSEYIRGYLLYLTSNGVSKASIKQKVAALKHFYSYMFSKNIITYDPFEFITTPKLDSRLPDFLEDEEVKQLFETNKKRNDSLVYRDQAIIELLYASGLRVSELVNLTMQNVNLKQRTLRVLGKGKKERIVPFSNSAKDALDIYLKQTRPILLSKYKSMQLNNYVFLNNNGYKLTVRGLEYILGEI